MEMTLNVKITGLESLVSVLEKLSFGAVNQPAKTIVQEEQSKTVVPAAVQAPQIQTTPVATVPVQTAAPIVKPAPTTVQPTAPVVPVTTPTYTQEQLALAATSLMDAGRVAELQSLVASFGVQALTQLPQEQYGNFATQLRAMGAKI